ncbi:MAG: hypothetical protein ACLRYM_06020 [Thomasclavelia ramosa]
MKEAVEKINEAVRLLKKKKIEKAITELRTASKKLKIKCEKEKQTEYEVK